jgi:hypothetical protein
VETIGIVAVVVVACVVVAALIVLASALPDFVRYRRLRKM